MAKENIIKTDLICEVQKKHINHKKEERKANELAELKEELKERNAEAKAYSRKVMLKKILKTALVVLGVTGFIAAYGIVSENDYIEAKSRERKIATETTTEVRTEVETTTEKPTTEEQTTANMETMENINVSEPITEEPTMEIKFFNVPLSEDIQLHIFSECEKYNISPALVIAIIERESTYDPSRVGDNGKSLGIMQIQPQWHNHRVDELGIVNFDWFNPYHNISVGCHFLNELFNKYGDDIYTVLMGYNGSPKYVRDMLNAGLVSDYALEVSARAEELEAE